MAASWRFLVRLENLAMLAVVVGLIVSVLLQVLSRYALGSYVSLAWTDEVARCLVAWLTFLGAVLLDRDNEHIHVTLITDMLSARAREFVGVLTDIMGILFLLLVLGSATESVQADAHSFMVSVPVPMVVVSASLVVGSALMVIHVCVRLWRRLMGLRGAPQA